jgi:hypothetical protein
MANLPKRLVIPLLVAAVTLACALLPRVVGIDVQERLAGTQSTQPSGAGPGATGTSTSLTATPGLLLEGDVHLTDGTPLGGVVICRSFASYQGSQVAVTDSNGEFSAEFVSIPGDEMVTIWPHLDGYSFDPAQVYWRHYFGFETSRLEFTASVQDPTAALSAGCP